MVRKTSLVINMAEFRIKGLGVSRGIRIGKAYIYKKQIKKSSINDNIVIDVSKELFRLESAIKATYKELEMIIEGINDSLNSVEIDILRVQQAFLQDPYFYPEIVKKITEKKFSAEKAVIEVTEYFFNLFNDLNDEYMRERASDIRDIGDRIINNINGGNDSKLANIEKGVILISEELKPSEVVQIDKEYIQGFITYKGGKTSHTAILARTLEIPAIMGFGDNLNKINNGDILIIDGNSGECIVNPNIETVEHLTEFMKLEMEEEKLIREYTLMCAKTIDGHEIEVAANIGNLNDARTAISKGINGVGLYRTEILFMNSDSLPTEDEQYQAYKEIVELMDNKPIIFRTLDIGGDKEIPFLELPKEDNPFLGYRAIRLTLNHKDLLVTQLRAIFKASAYGKIKIMFPMISNLQEWRLAKGILEEVKEQLRIEGSLFDENIEVGIMVEIPSTAVLAEHFAKEVDFFSIGTNDLVQYTLAVDRMNEQVAYLYDYFNPAVLRLIKYTVEAAHNEGKWVGMCGDMAGDPIATPLLIGLGLDELSMDIGSLLRIKRLIANLKYNSCKELSENIMRLTTVEEIKIKLMEYRK